MLVDMNSWALIAVVMAFAFGADIDHAGLSGGVEMG